MDVEGFFDGVVVHRFPFPYLTKYPALPQDIYAEIEDQYPDWRDIAGADAPENARFDLQTAALLNRSDVFSDLAQTFTSREFFGQVWDVFANDIRLLYPLADLMMGKPVLDWSIGPRGAGNFDANMIFNVGVNTPSTTESRVRGPHVDNPVELFGGLLYVGGDDQGGDLNILEYTDNPIFQGRTAPGSNPSIMTEIDDSCVSIVDTIKYRPNQLVMFVNSWFSVHGVTNRAPGPRPRRLIAIACDLRKPLFRVPP